jgi:hypothetical protein
MTEVVRISSLSTKDPMFTKRVSMEDEQKNDPLSQKASKKTYTWGNDGTGHYFRAIKNEIKESGNIYIYLVVFFF